MDESMTGWLQNGFAVAVAAWLLVRTERKLETLTEAINELQRAIASLRRGGDGRRE